MIEFSVETLKRQNLPYVGHLWMVATPLGNLSDLSPRARSVLASVEVLLAEDTRRARALFSALEIATPRRILRLDAHVEQKSLEPILDEIALGRRVAFVSDAGTPGVSDPGARLVARAHARGIRVEPIPGPSAVTAFLSVAGFSGSAFVFRGFFPRKKAERERELRSWMQTSAFCGSGIWFESPERVLSSLKDFLTLLSSEQEVCIAKELSKTFERVWRGSASTMLPRLIQELSEDATLERGEWVLGLEQNLKNALVSAQSGDWRHEARERIMRGEKAAHIARDLSQRFGVSREDAYAEALSAQEIRRKSSRGT
jgi:16S rRNA (cytidine1402-2'-O)-methyltransferase